MRLTSNLFLEVVTAHRWSDMSTKIGVTLTKWRQCFRLGRT